MGGMTFSSWSDAFSQAHLRAWATGRRYKVRYDLANKVWDITEMVARVGEAQR